MNNIPEAVLQYQWQTAGRVLRCTKVEYNFILFILIYFQIYFLCLYSALEMGVCFHRDPAFGEYGGTLLFLGIWEKGKFLYLEKVYKEFKRYVKRAM
jgi:hypothetical protein